MPARLTQAQFLKRARAVHGNRYGYNSAIYVNSRTEVKIYCKKCKAYFPQTPHVHLGGHGCPACANKERGLASRHDTEQFIADARAKHGDRYGYDSVYYVHSQTEVCIFCPRCGQYFWQTPSGHKAGDGCPTCGNEKVGASRRHTLEQFIAFAQLVHGDLYEYNDVVYVNSRTKVKIFCRSCGSFFMQTPHGHLDGKGCPRCKKSSGEKIINRYLTRCGIRFDVHVTVRIGGRAYYFDFILPYERIVIEYNGLQHYQPVDFFEGEEGFQETQRRDKVKADWVKQSGYKLIVIPYWIKNIPAELYDRLIEAYPPWAKKT